MARPRCLEWSLLRVAVSSMVLAFVAAVARAANVTITHLRLDTTHDSPYSPWDPSVYFQCEGEMKHVLQGVVQANLTYNFTGQEDFQPLVELANAQCKTCGLYEADTFKADDTFDKFQLCADDFRGSKEGRVTRWVDGEFKVAMSCPDCLNSHDHSPVEALLQGDSWYPPLQFLIFLAAAAAISCTAALLSCCIERCICPSTTGIPGTATGQSHCNHQEQTDFPPFPPFPSFPPRPPPKSLSSALLQGDSWYPLLPFLIFLAAAAAITCTAALLSCCIERRIWPFQHKNPSQPLSTLEKQQLAEATAFIGSSDEEEEEEEERERRERGRGRGSEIGIEMGDLGRSGVSDGEGEESGGGSVGGSGRKAQGECLHGRPYSVPREDERVDV
ncbi:unnamed protein product [Closterium sp. NIES-64]|nr:unnamed protein product [Closterium sp. NIES-64]